MSIESVLSSPMDRQPVFLTEFRYGDQFWRYTTGGVPYNDLGNIFVPHELKIPKIRRSTSETTTSADLILPDDDPVVQIFDSFLPIEPVTCIVRQVELNDPTGATRAVLIGDVTNCEDSDDGTSKVTVKPTYEATNRTVPSQAQQDTCVWMLYGTGCKVNPDLYRTPFSNPIQLSGLIVQASELAAAKPSDPTWFKAGFIRCIRTREVRFIVDHQANGVIVINYPFGQAKTTDQFEAYAGCMKTGTICHVKFNNKIRFMGFEQIPSRNVFKVGLK